MAKIIIELNFKDQPKAMLNIVVGAIKEQMKEQVKQFGMEEKDVNVRVEK